MQNITGGIIPFSSIYRNKKFINTDSFKIQMGVLERIMACIPPTLEGWVYIIPIHGPLDGSLYTWAQYTPTPPCSLNYRRSGVQDWTTRKLTPPAV